MRALGVNQHSKVAAGQLIIELKLTIKLQIITALRLYGRHGLKKDRLFKSDMIYRY